MAMAQCKVGHLYDDAKYKTCPFCDEIQKNSTVKMDKSVETPEIMGTVPLESVRQSVAETTSVPVVFPGMPAVLPEYETEKRDQLTVGWLMCITGPKCGRSFEVADTRNTIGRDNTNDINLDFDDTIGKGINAVLSYDSKNNKCFIFLGESKNNIYVNDNLLMVPIELKDYDVIKIGSTKLIFRSLCNERFNWEAIKKDDFVRVDGLEKDEGDLKQNGKVNKRDIPLAGIPVAPPPIPSTPPKNDMDIKKQKKAFGLFKMFWTEKKFKPENNIMPCVYASPGNFGNFKDTKK